MKLFYFCKEFIIRDGVLLKYKGKKSRVVIPDTVTGIGESAFIFNLHLVEVVIPEGVTEIGEYAFYSCKNLETVHIPTSIASIGGHAFARCAHLQQVDLRNIQVIHYGAFENCKALEKVLLPDADTTILVSSLAFAGCPKLADEDGFIVLKTFLFEYIGEATHVTIPDGVKVIGCEAFPCYSKIETVICPDSVQKILLHAFNNCEELSEITIPNRLTEVDDNAFFGGKKNIKICAPEGSNAQRWIEKNTPQFQSI